MKAVPDDCTALRPGDVLLAVDGMTMADRIAELSEYFPLPRTGQVRQRAGLSPHERGGKDFPGDFAPGRHRTDGGGGQPHRGCTAAPPAPAAA